MNIELNGKALGKMYYGAGMVSGNNSSRLLLDYKYEQPERYWEILEHIFGRDGICVNHLKLEMGSDINSTSGTEPCVMRYEDEPADVSRGAGYILAADAKKINPDLALDMLFWSEPRWVTSSEDVYAARYKWYAETLRAAYKAYGLRFDYISVSRNERDIDGEWIKYIGKRIKAEKDAPYDFSQIKLVAADEDNAWHIADIMMCDEGVRDAVDVIGTHYTSHSTENAKKLSEQYGKELWFSEGSPPMTNVKGLARFGRAPLDEINGVLDIAARIAAMYPCGGMTMYEYQPVASAYYDGVTFCHKQLIDASEPWSGYYRLESGYYMAAMFGTFFKKGWRYIDNACMCDGEKGGDGHALTNIKNCFMSMTDGKDYSVMMINTTDEKIDYKVKISNLPDYRELYIYRFSDGFGYDKIGTIKGGNEVNVPAAPFAITVLSTLDARLSEGRICRSKILPLPYEDSFDYPSERTCPRYTTDQGGAFETANRDGKNVLMQIITPETKAMEWGGTPNPMTNFGDDRWYNYSIEAGCAIEKSGSPSENYIGIGGRCFLGCSGNNGYSVYAYENGKWELRRNGEVLESGKAKFNAAGFTVRLEMNAGEITGYINSKKLFVYSENISQRAAIGAGRGALYSSYNKNSFEYIRLEPIGQYPYIERFDDTDNCFVYFGDWEHKLMSGFGDYKRTFSEGKRGCRVVLDYTGAGFGIFGANKSECRIKIDGEETTVVKSGSRELIISKELPMGHHTIEIKVLSGRLNIDGVQIGKVGLV